MEHGVTWFILIYSMPYAPFTCDSEAKGPDKKQLVTHDK
jgi:hypothetical protein